MSSTTHTSVTGTPTTATTSTSTSSSISSATATKTHAQNANQNPAHHNQHGKFPKRPSEIHGGLHQHPAEHDGPSAGWIVLGIILLLFVLVGAWYAYRYFRAKRMGLPAPSLNPFSDQHEISRNYPAQGGLVGWLRGLKNRRTARGAYEGTTYGGGSGAGFGGAARGGANTGRSRGALDPDEAWDAQVGAEADDMYYEEQELGLRARPSGDGHYGGRGYGDDVELQDRSAAAKRRSELDARFDEDMGRGRPGAADPFGEGAEASNLSLRGVSPRPYEDDGRSASAQGRHAPQLSVEEPSPTERKSMFREDV